MNTESAIEMERTSVEDFEGYALWASEDANLDVFESNQISGGELAMYLHPDRAGELSGTSTISGNEDDRIHLVFSNTNRVSTDATWKNLGVPYYVTDRFFIAAPLDLDAGVTLEMAQDVGITVEPGGSLSANGTEDDPVTLRGATATAGFWRGLRFDSDESANRMEHTFLQHTGSSTWTGDQESDAALYMADDTALTLINVEIGPGDGYGLHLRDGVNLSCSSMVFSSLQDGAVYDDVTGSVLPGC